MKKIIIAVLCLSMGWAAAQKKKTGASKSQNYKSNRVSSPKKAILKISRSLSVSKLVEDSIKYQLKTKLIEI